MAEFYLGNNKLLSEEEWKKQIESFKNADGKSLKQVLEGAVLKRIPSSSFGICFSGGVDSSFIAALCKKANADFTCYAVGFGNSADVEYAKKVASFLNLKLKLVELGLEDIERLAKEVVAITKKCDIVTVGVGIVLAACLKMPEKMFFTGLGSEEIFAGYERHEKAKDINIECWNGLLQMWKRDLKRDVPIAAANNIQLLTPFLDKNVIISAMKINGDEKIKLGIKKFVLRKLAEPYLGDFAWRKKKAAQYGSNVIKALDKLTKQNGFKYKKDYLMNLL